MYIYIYVCVCVRVCARARVCVRSIDQYNFPFSYNYAKNTDLTKNRLSFKT